MPEIGKRNASRRGTRMSERVAFNNQREREEFEIGFRRSKKGNLWRHYGNLFLTVFRRGEGWGWCIAYPDDDRNPEFSPDTLGDEAEAIEALWEIVNA